MSRFQAGIWVILTTTLVTGFATGECQGQSPFTLHAGAHTVLPNGSVDVPIYLDVNTSVGASNVTFGFTYKGFLDLTSITQGSALTALNGGSGAGQFLVDTQEATGDTDANSSTPSGAPPSFKGATLQLTIPDQTLTDFLTMGPDQEIAVLHFTDGSDKPSTDSAIEFTSALSGALGSPIGDVLIEVTDDTLPPDPPVTYDESGTPPGVEVVNGFLLVIPHPVTSFLCMEVDDCLCEVLLTWTNGMDYDQLNLYVGSTATPPIETFIPVGGPLPEMYSVVQTDPTVTYILVGTFNATDSAAAECSVMTTCTIPIAKRR